MHEVCFAASPLSRRISRVLVGAAKQPRLYECMRDDIGPPEAQLSLTYHAAGFHRTRPTWCPVLHRLGEGGHWQVTLATTEDRPISSRNASSNLTANLMTNIAGTYVSMQNVRVYLMTLYRKLVGLSSVPTYRSTPGCWNPSQK
jgi:hypothetical protein